MKRQLIAAALVSMLAVFGAAAIEVNENELKSTGGADTIVFQNYTGPHSVIESAETISAIGTALGRQVASSQGAATFGQGEKYTVIHAIDPSSQGKLDADIILINKNATVDHIRNLRRIIASYLSAAYGYNKQDASTVATFVTVYNAVYRSKMDNFTSKYKEIVTKNLAPATCGLSTKWNEWPGNSQIVIPLGDLSSDISAVDTSVISDKKVVESMQEQDDKGVDERKNMVDIKEREAEKATEKAQEAAKKSAQENKKLEEQKQVQKEAEKKAEQKQEEAVKAQEEAKADPQNEEKQQAAEQAAQEAQQAAETAQEEAAKTEEQQQTANEAAQEAQAQQQVADKKQTEAQTERTAIAKDQQEIIQNTIAEATNTNTVIGLKITDSANKLSTMVKVDAANGDIIRESPVTVIRARTMYPVSDPVVQKADAALSQATEGAASIDANLFYMAICGENTNNGAVKLCLLDAYKMEIQKESTETVAEDSVLVNSGDSYYCIIQNGSNWVVGKYDKSLNLQLKSPVSVAPETPITVTPKGIIVTSKSGNITLLKTEDLTAILDTTAAK